MRIALYSMMSIILLSTTAFAAPLLHDFLPSNNSYMGNGLKMFSVNVTDSSLNQSSVTLRIISESAHQQGESWDSFSMSCEGSGAEWNCTKSLSFAIVGSDTAELFYFTANDTSGASGNNGTVANPLRFVLDRNPPAIVFSNPANGSYAGGNKTIYVEISDSSSGVKSGTVQFSTDLSQWTNMSNSTPQTFSGTWNTTTFSNNQTVILYARAYDIVSNMGISNVNVSIDNELPKIIVLSSLSGKQRGSVPLEILASDNHSGVSTLSYSVGSLSGTLGCSGSIYNSTCSAVLNTAGLLDGNYTLNITVADKANNTNTTSVPFESYNMQPSVSITAPPSNAFIAGDYLVKADLVNTADVNYVEIILANGSTLLRQNMTCDSNFASCNYSLGTAGFSDGGYTIKVNATNKYIDATKSVPVTIDNTKPSVSIVNPASSAAGNFVIDADIIDTNFNQSSAKFSLGTIGGNLVCTPQTPSRYTCSTTYISNSLPGGSYELQITAKDKAGNSANASKQITISNSGSSSGSPGSSSGGGADSGASSGASSGPSGLGNAPSEPAPQPSITFKSEYVLMGVIAMSILFVFIILILIAVHKLGKPIIVEE